MPIPSYNTQTTLSTSSSTACVPHSTPSQAFKSSLTYTSLQKYSRSASVSQESLPHVLPYRVTFTPRRLSKTRRFVAACFEAHIDFIRRRIGLVRELIVSRCAFVYWLLLEK